MFYVHYLSTTLAITLHDWLSALEELCLSLDLNLQGHVSPRFAGKDIIHYAIKEIVTPEVADLSYLFFNQTKFVCTLNEPGA